MDLTTLEMSKEEAAERLRHYEKQVQEERTVEDEAIRAGYRAAARGLPVIQLSKCIEAGGFFDTGLPRIAICRATATNCWVRVNDWRAHELVYGDNEWLTNRGALVGVHTVRVSVPSPETRVSRAWRGKTVVPLIPPQLRPKKSRVRGFHILWEVESWTNLPPVDPALLRHIRGDLWSVVATWELTALERAVLSARG